MTKEAVTSEDKESDSELDDAPLTSAQRQKLKFDTVHRGICAFEMQGITILATYFVVAQQNGIEVDLEVCFCRSQYHRTSSCKL